MHLNNRNIQNKDIGKRILLITENHKVKASEITIINFGDKKNSEKLNIRIFYLSAKCLRRNTPNCCF